MQIKQIDLFSKKLIAMNHRLLYFCTLFLLVIEQAFAQVERTKNWYFGESLGLQINDTLFPTLLSNSQITTPGGCASISDSSGQLLFYTNGQTIWNSNHTVMFNGNSMAGDGNASQSSLIIPDPGNANQYYVFTIGGSCNNTLHYSVVDMSLQGSLGAVTQINVALDSNMIQKITGVANQASNGYWIITHADLSSAFYAYPLTSAGIGTPIISNVGTVINGSDCFGVLKASPLGNKIAMTFPANNGFELYNFDNATGIVYNAMFIGNTLTEPTYGCEFSSNGNYIYCNAAISGVTPPSIYQYDITLANAGQIDSSKVLVGFSQSPFIYTSMQLGLDGKIYCAGTNRDYISFIQQPNNPGFACNYVENAFYLGGNVTQYGLPNFISTYLAGITSVQNSEVSDGFLIYPNPVKNYFVVEGNNSANFSVKLFDATGRIIATEEEKFRTGKKVTIKNIKSGIYFVQLSGRNATITQRIMVVE